MIEIDPFELLGRKKRFVDELSVHGTLNEEMRPNLC
jgi:hypothetical protein